MDALLNALQLSAHRRRAPMLAAGALVGAGLTLLAALLLRAQERCNPAPHWARVLPSERAQASRKAFSALEGGEAQGARQAESALATLQRCVTSWSDEYARACPANAVPVLRCLEHPLQETSALVQRFEKPNVQAVRRAPEAARALRSPSGCVRGAALAEPFDEASAREETALRAQLAAARADGLSGSFRAAAEAARAVAVRARELANGPLEAEALDDVSYFLRLLEEPADAEEATREAVLAAERSGHDDVRVRALVRLAWFSSQARDSTTEVEVRAAYASALIERLGGYELERADLDYYRGVAAIAADKQEAARAHLDRAVAARMRAGGELALELGGYLITRASVLLELKQLEDARRDVLQAKRIFLEHHGPEYPGLGPVLSLMGGVEAQSGHAEDALRWYREGAQHMARHLGRTHRHYGVALYNQADTLKFLKRFDEALPIAREALAIAQKNLPPDSPRLPVVLLLVAHLEHLKNRPGDALPLLERALQICEPARCEKRQTARIQLLTAMALLAGRRDPVRTRVLLGKAISSKGLSEKDSELAQRLLHARRASDKP